MALTRHNKGDRNVENEAVFLFHQQAFSIIMQQARKALTLFVCNVCYSKINSATILISLQLDCLLHPKRQGLLRDQGFSHSWNGWSLLRQGGSQSLIRAFLSHLSVASSAFQRRFFYNHHNHFAVKFHCLFLKMIEMICPNKVCV